MLGKQLNDKPKKRILCIDDDPAVTELLSEFCSDVGYEVKCLNDSRIALSEALKWQPHLITLDLEMPGKDGLEVLDELRSEPATRTIPIVIISTLGDDSLVPVQRVQAVFDKPIRVRPLLQKIQNLLEPIAG